MKALLFFLIVMTYNSLFSKTNEGQSFENSTRNEYIFLSNDSLLKHYHGDIKLPVKLLKTYSLFVQTIKTSNKSIMIEKIKEFCLPQSVSITEAIRPKEKREYGEDINIEFLQKDFSSYIMNIRKDNDTCYLIRTASTALWFVETASMEWKIYKYLDKPIE